jgi:Amino acid transporters
MLRNIKRILLGEKLPTNKLSEEKFNVFWGLPVLASDAISSVAYAVDEILWALVPIVGLTSYVIAPKIALAIMTLLLVLTISYRQIVSAYPNGGGAYIVAKDNLKVEYGLIVAASLSVDYILTVAVSISAGTAAVTSAIPVLYDDRIAIALFFIALMTIGNLRGIRDSSKLFSIPTYAFMVSILALLIVGLVKSIGIGMVTNPVASNSSITLGTQALSLFLLLKAFSSGCAAVTGVEAICDAVPNFKEPAVKNAKLAYVLLTIAVIITFGGITYLTTVFHPVPSPEQTGISQLSAQIFGRGLIFYFIQATTTIVLAMAANTAFAGFPILLSIVAQDGYVPRQFALRGHRLGFSNGILLLSIMAGALVIVFKGDTHLLIPLYAIGVFTSFTLAQAGICLKWLRTKPKGWAYKSFINGLGTIITFITVVVIAITKFLSGAWVVLIIIPIMVFLMMKVRKHYTAIAKDLDIPNDKIDRLKLNAKPKPYVIIPIQSLNVMVIKTLRYAKSISDEVEVFHVETYEGEADKLRKKWAKLNTDVPLIIKQSPYREVVDPLIEYLKSNEHSSQANDVINVMLPQFIVEKRWEMALHNNTSLFIAGALIEHRNIVVSFVPFKIGEKSKLYKNIDVEIE